LPGVTKAVSLIAYTVGGLIGLDGLARKVLTLEAATPSAVMSLVLATEFDADVPFGALAVLTTTLVSVITVTGRLFRLM
jgi:predicted permease